MVKKNVGIPDSHRKKKQGCPLVNTLLAALIAGSLSLPQAAVSETLSGGYSTSQNDSVTGREVNANQDAQGVFGGYSYYYEGPNPWYSYSNEASTNTATVTVGYYTPFATRANDTIAVAGGYANRTANENKVTISGGTFNGGGVFGGFVSDPEGFDNNGSACGNTISIEGGSGEFSFIAGGYAYTEKDTGKQATASNNSVTIQSDITVLTGQQFRMDYQYQSVALAGGLATQKANYNTVNISNGTYTGIVCGGMTFDKTGEASTNTVNISGGTVTGTVYGAWINGGTAEHNTVNISGTATIDGNICSVGAQNLSGAALSGTVHITGDANLSAASVHGYNQYGYVYDRAQGTRNFQLNIQKYNGSIYTVDRFHAIQIEDSNVHYIYSIDGDVWHGGSYDQPGETRISVKNSFLNAEGIINFATFHLEDATLNAEYVAGLYNALNVGAFNEYSITAKNTNIYISDEITKYNTLSIQNDVSKTVFLQKITGNDDSTTDIQSGFVEIGSSITVTGGSFKVNNSKDSHAFTTKIYNNITAKEYESKGAQVDIGFNTKDSFFTGATAIKDSNSSLALSFADSARWNMTQDSRVSKLTLKEGVVNLAYESSTPARTLTIGTLAGPGGTFIVNTNISEDKSDQIIIEKGSGQHKLLVQASGSEPSREAMDNFIVQQQSGTANFTLANAGAQVESGLYMYELASRTNQNADDQATEWYLKRLEKLPDDPDPAPPVNPNPPLSPTGEAEAALSGFAGHYAMWYGQLTDLRKRLGEVRYGTQEGLWVRGFADQARLDGLRGTGFTQYMYGGSIGYDTLAAMDKEYMWLVGMQLRCARAHQSVNGHWGGHGELTSGGVGLYSTWVHADGWYVDAVGTLDWFNHKIRTTMLDGTKVHDDRSSYALGASLEAGRKFDFAFSNERREYWFLEPQFQLSYFWVKGGDFTASNGMQINQEDMDSLTGRAGFVLGKNFALDGGNGSRYIQPYVKAGLNHEFLGEQEAHINGVRMTSDMEGTRVYYGAGVDWQATDTLRLYMQVEREHGEHFTREYNVSAGLKWKF